MSTQCQRQRCSRHNTLVPVLALERCPAGVAHDAGRNLRFETEGQLIATESVSMQCQRQRYSRRNTLVPVLASGLCPTGLRRGARFALRNEGGPRSHGERIHAASVMKMQPPQHAGAGSNIAASARQVPLRRARFMLRNEGGR